MNGFEINESMVEHYAKIDAEDEEYLKRMKKQVESEDPLIRSSSALCGFLELAIHHLLYVKNVYPINCFKSIRRNNFKIWTCKHPGVRKYILDFLDFCHQLLVKDKNLRISFVLKRNSGIIIECYNFDVKVNELIQSQDEVVDVIDRLLSICEDIERNNTFSDSNDQGENGITFELQIRIRAPAFLPSIAQNFPWTICLDQERDSHVEEEPGASYEFTINFQKMNYIHSFPLHIIIFDALQRSIIRY